MLASLCVPVVNVTKVYHSSHTGTSIAIANLQQNLMKHSTTTSNTV